MKPEFVAIAIAVMVVFSSVISAWVESICRRLIAENESLRRELARYKRGELTEQEFHDLCHHLDEQPGCTRKAFEAGCRAYQDKLFGPARRVCGG